MSFSVSDEAIIECTPLGTKLAKKKLFQVREIVKVVSERLSADEVAEWQKLENMNKANLTSYDYDRLLFFAQKCGLITIKEPA